MNINKEQKIDLAKIICAAVLFAAGETFSHFQIGFEFDGISIGLSLILFLLAYIIAGYESIFTAIRNIAHGQVFDENFLMTIATIGALCLKQWDEAVAVMLFYSVGEFFESCAVDKSRNSISDLMDLRPDYANLLKDDKEEQVDPYDIQIGDIILVKPGEKIPLDGTVIEGSAALDTAALTGESLPREVEPGDEVISGCINISSVLKIKVTGLFEDSTVSKILDLVENAGSKKAKVEKFITKFARYYTPAVVFAAIALALIPPLFVPGQMFSDWVYRALLFLVISCPCALVISVPLSFFGGIGAAGKSGVLVKGSNYLEALADVDTVVFDKTGTLTTGTFKVISAEGPSDLLELTALAEYHSSHPIALSIKEAALKQATGLFDTNRIENVEELPGKGLSATIDNRKVYAGNKKLMDSLNLDCPPSNEIATVIYVAVDGNYYGSISISDTLKKDSASAVKKLKEAGIKHTIMLTGDRKAIAQKVAEETALDSYQSELLPADKVNATEEIISKAAKKVAFVGDGINDAPVLARADIGVAMGGLGSQAAIEAADIVIMDDSLSKLAKVISIAKRTLFIAKQNVVFALAVKGLILILGALGFANMWMAIFADVGVSAIAILNAMRTLLIK